MHEVRFFKVDKFDYEIGEEKWVAAIKTNFVPRIGDNVAVLSDEDPLEVIRVNLYYDEHNDPMIEVYIITEDVE